MMRFPLHQGFDNRQARTPDLEQSNGLAPAIADNTATEIELGRSDWKDLNGDFDSFSQSYGICSGTGASFSPNWHSSPVTGFGVVQPTSFLSLERRALDSPMLKKLRRVDEPQIHEQVLSTLGDSERLMRSFMNDILQHYVVDRPGVYLVDSNELAKWDTTSYWNAPVKDCPAARPEAPEPKPARRLIAQAARKTIIPSTILSRSTGHFGSHSSTRIPGLGYSSTTIPCPGRAQILPLS